MSNSSSAPSFSERGVYFATHFRNWYEEATDAEVVRYLQELSEWGLTGVAAWFDMHDFASIGEPGARRRLRRIKLIFEAAKRLELRRDLLFLANEAFTGSPPELRANWRAGRNGYNRDLVGHFHVELCPSKRGAVELLLAWRRQVFDAFAEMPPTDITIFPYDQGGCTCNDCAPWGANGFLRLARPLADLARKSFPGVRVNLSTWNFDAYGDTHEWEGLFAYGRELATWCDRLYVAPRDLARIRERTPGGIPAFSTTEISMRGMLPWGGYGANPMPECIQREISDNPELDGMRPYSEGIYEDLNKVMVLGVLRDPSKTTLDIAGDYAVRYFGEATRAPVAEAVRLMEGNMGHVAHAVQGEIVRDAYALGAVAPDRPWRFSHTTSRLDRDRAQRVKSLLDEAEGRMTAERRASWRFRLLRLRAEIDCALADGTKEGRLEPLFEELARIGRVSARTPLWLVPPARSLWLRVKDLWQTCL